MSFPEADGLEGLDTFELGRFGATPEFNCIGPGGSEHCSVSRLFSSEDYYYYFPLYSFCVHVI